MESGTKDVEREVVLRKKPKRSVKEEQPNKPPVCKDMVITRSPDSDVHAAGGIELKVWNSVVASDPSMRKRPYYCGTDARTREWRKYPLTGGAIWVASDWNSFSFSNGRILALDCDAPSRAKARELAEKLGAQCVPLGKGPRLHYRPGQSKLWLDREFIELGFPIGSAIWWRLHGLILVLEESRMDILHILNGDGKRYGDMAPPAEFLFYYLTTFCTWGVSVVCVPAGEYFPLAEDWHFVIDLERNQLNPMAPSR